MGLFAGCLTCLAHSQSAKFAYYEPWEPQNHRYLLPRNWHTLIHLLFRLRLYSESTFSNAIKYVQLPLGFFSKRSKNANRATNYTSSPPKLHQTKQTNNKQTQPNQPKQTNQPENKSQQTTPTTNQPAPSVSLQAGFTAGVFPTFSPAAPGSWRRCPTWSGLRTSASTKSFGASRRGGGRVMKSDSLDVVGMLWGLGDDWLWKWCVFRSFEVFGGLWLSPLKSS